MQHGFWKLKLNKHQVVFVFPNFRKGTHTARCHCDLIALRGKNRIKQVLLQRIVLDNQDTDWPWLTMRFLTHCTLHHQRFSKTDRKLGTWDSTPLCSLSVPL